MKPGVTAVPFAIVHHANQYLISNGYINRQGIAEILGPSNASSGLRAVMELHCQYQIPFHLHISGTFIEACAWFDPGFLREIAELRQSGLLEVMGSAYSQNIMPLFSQRFNRHQVEEELRLLQRWLNVPPEEIKGFWIPERVWNTKKLAGLLADPDLVNGRFLYLLTDDRLLLPQAERTSFDQCLSFRPDLFQAYRIKGGRGLIALPLSTEIRVHVPFETDDHQSKLEDLVAKLKQRVEQGDELIAIYGDDMEKAAGIPPMWNERALEHYHRFLRWLADNPEVRTVLLQSYLAQIKVDAARTIEPGTYLELATRFGAGEDYQGWASSTAWQPYQRILRQMWRKLLSLSSRYGEEGGLLRLARKLILASAYETGWHDPEMSGAVAHWEHAAPAPWARALVSHARTAQLLMEAVRWAAEGVPGQLEAVIKDFDQDGLQEVVLRNERLAVVITPRYGGRIIYGFSFQDGDGLLFIGNPLDDWNLLEEVNDFMDTPMNHPGALADYGFEHDAYEVISCSADTDTAELVMINRQENSAAYGLIKRLTLRKGESSMRIRYEQVPSRIQPLSLDAGLSPDYARLLQEGRAVIAPCQEGSKRGFRNGSTFAWVTLESGSNWRIPRNPIFGHGCCLGLTLASAEGSFLLGVDRSL